MVAVVRGSGNEAAYSRLRAGYNSGDPELLQVFDDLARAHLRVYAGEQRPLLGSFTIGMGSIAGPGFTAKPRMKHTRTDTRSCMHAACVRRSLAILVCGASVMSICQVHL